MRLRLRFGTLLLRGPVLGLLLAGVSPARAEIWYVPTQIFTMATAIEAAAPGDTIRVVGNGGATYFVNLIIDKDLTIEGGWRADFQLRDPEVYVSVLRDTNGVFIRPVVRVDGSRRVVIDGFHILGGRFGVYAEGAADLIVRNCQFREQVNGDDILPFGGKAGGAVRTKGGTLVMENVEIRDLRNAFHGAGFAVENMTSVILRDCTIEDCVNFPFFFGFFTPAFGGAFYAVNVGDLRFERTTIRRCASLFRGGLGYVINSSATFVDCELRDGAGSQGGGALRFEDCSSLRFEGTTIENCQANEGGALFVNQAGLLAMEGCTVRSNRGTVQGGAVWVDGTPLDIRDCLFEENNDPSGALPSRGGSFRCTNSGGTVTGTTFRNERATGRGGAWYQVGGVVDFVDCTFEGNDSRLYGGGLHIELSGALRLRDCLLVRNSAKLGGAIGASFTGRVELDGCTFSENAGRTSGAALYLDTGGSADILDSIVCCATQGDLVYCSSAGVRVSHSDIWNDDATNLRQEFGGSCANPIGSDGNISANPLFCAGDAGYRLASGSPCEGAASDGGAMGWAPVGCPAPTPLGLEEDSWGRVKARYREGGR